MYYDKYKITITTVLFLAFIGLLGCTQKNEVSENSASENNTSEISLTDKEMKQASDLFFNTCAGCHGTTRKGATGPSLLPDDRTRQLGTETIKAFITHGTPGGMPDWGKQGILDEEEIDLLARFVQLDPPQPPEMSLAEMKKFWKVHVAPEDRPTSPQHNRNWENFFGVILRDAGKVAIIDGDTKEILKIVDTGFAVHILRSSSTGRYFYSIGRDGKVTLIDLWTEEPTIVAEGKAAYDARSIEVSKYKGPEGDFTDKYAIVGGYWPAHLVIMDGLTLEPLKIISTSGYTVDENEFLREARVAAIVAAHESPEWVINIKETGQVWVVDYTDIENLEVSMIDAERFLHDGGWDYSRRYFMVAANNKDKIAAIDVKTNTLEALIDVGTTPHPGRGVTFKHPELGPIWGTGHLGDNTLAMINTDPNSDKAWEVVKTVELPGSGGGNLFVKTHPKSEHIWADRTLNNNKEMQRSIFVIDKNDLEVIKTFKVPEKYNGRFVHFEYNKAGDEVWVSVWGSKDQSSAVLVYDDKNLELKNEIAGDWAITPTGKFNVYNTTHEIY